MKCFRLLPLLLLTVLFVSCEKGKSEWTNHYGYTNDDVVGTYDYSNVATAFDGLTDNAYCHLCYDAKVDIRAVSSTEVKVTVVGSNEGLNVEFSGRPTTNDDDFLLTLAGQGAYRLFDLTSYVYTNAKGQTRIHGFVRKNAASESGHDTNYYFDVIKN